jgi:tetratricopeptide (TPR) repeat protein
MDRRHHQTDQHSLAWIGLGLTAAALAIAAAVLFSRPRTRPEMPSPPPKSIERRLADAQRGIDANPDDIAALTEKGLLLYKKGTDSYLEAITTLESARDKGSLNPNIFYSLGDMYRAEGLYDYAAREYMRYLNNFPDNRDARLMLGKLYYEAGKYDEALEEFSKLASAGTPDVIVMENTALTLYKAGRKDEAKAMLNKMRAMNPQAAHRASYSEASILEDEGKYSDAAAILAPLLEQSGADRTLNRADVLRLYARALDKLNRPGDSYNAWNELVSIDPHDAEAAKAFKAARKQMSKTVKAQKTQKAHSRKHK